MNRNAPHVDDFDDTMDERFTVSISGAADFLSMRGAKPTVALLSPSGDDGSTASVMLARSIAELGRSVVMVDMTASGCPTRLMSQEAGLAGISDLLFGETAFGETIHHDRLSNAHIVPQGNAQPQHAGRIIEQLTMIMRALADTYDTVLLEFGAADVEGVAKLLKYIDAEIVMSRPGADSPVFAEAFDQLAQSGYSDIVVMGTP